MRMESAGFGTADLDVFLDQLVEMDRRALVERLEQASVRLAELAARVPDGTAAPDSGDWNAKEVLAHVAVLSRFYGVLTYRIGTGALTELDLLDLVHQRDAAGEQLVGRPAAELAAMARADHRRTLDWLRAASPEQLRRRCDVGAGRWMTAEEVARLPLTSHLEQHVAQLEHALNGP